MASVRWGRLGVALIASIVPAIAVAQAAAPARPVPALLGNLSLNAARALMTDGNRTIRVARRALDVAASEIRRADVAPNPTLTASVSNSLAGHYHPADSDRILRLEQTFERGDKRPLRIATAKASRVAAAFELAEVTRVQRISLAQAYFDLIGAQRGEAIARENAAAYDRLVDAAERRRRAGDLAEVDVARLRVEGSRAANDARAAAAALQQAQVALAAVLGVEEHATAIRASDDFPALDANDPARSQPRLPTRPESIAEALERRADVAAARARVEALARAVELAASQRTRDVTLGVQAERAPSYGGNVFGLSATIPLFVNNDYSGDVARAQADLEQANDELARVRGIVRADIARATVQLEDALDRGLRLARVALPQAQQAANAIEFAFTRGAATLTDLFDARRQLAAVRMDAVSAHADFAKALAAWTEALALEEPAP